METAKLMMRIQLALNSRGYCNCKIDGQFGTATENALKQFQRDQGLNATGLPSSDTLQRLGISF
jgi:peptidoglycan hydrolase-like protein with peptidoglycan-binding domain